MKNEVRDLAKMRGENEEQVTKKVEVEVMEACKNC